MTQQIKISLFTGILLLMIMLIYFNWKNIDSSSSINAMADSSVANDKYVDAISTKESSIKADVEMQQSLPNANIQQSAQVDEVLSWQAARGWYDSSNETQDDYKTYSEETLKQLAENGDIKALHLLARWAPLEMANQLYTKAAVYGSTFALFNIGETLITQSGITKEMPEEIKRPVLIEAAAYVHTAAMRGDLYNAKYVGIVLFESRFNMKLNSDDLKLVGDRAQEIYSSLESQRIVLGLGQFDNSIPPAIKKYFSESGVEVTN